VLLKLPKYIFTELNQNPGFQRSLNAYWASGIQQPQKAGIKEARLAMPVDLEVCKEKNIESFSLGQLRTSQLCLCSLISAVH
jgi:hypothetical protein